MTMTPLFTNLERHNTILAHALIPSITWTIDMECIRRERQRLALIHDRLADVVACTGKTDYDARWHMTAELALFQLDQDMSDLETWLDTRTEE